jgi:hypothetical protein
MEILASPEPTPTEGFTLFVVIEHFNRKFEQTDH